MELITVTEHAFKRAKERLGWKKSAINKMANKAWRDGISHKQAKGKLKKHIDHIHNRYYHFHGKHNYAIIKVYGEVIYMFNQMKLVTLYRIDNKIVKHLKYQ